MSKELIEAVKADIGREAFVTWLSELSILEKEIDHTVAHLAQWTKPVSVDTPVFLGPAKSRIVFEPLGVVCILGSWNFPIYSNLSPLINVIAAGNCAVIKPSEIAPSSLRKVKALITRNLDLQCYACIEGQVEVAKALTSSKFDSICFTGSPEKGRLVAEAAGKNLVPCVLELGGKSPVIIDESANLDLAAKKIVQGKFLNAGQVCIAPDYVLLSHSVTEKFVTLLEKYIKDLWSEGTNVNDLGRIVNDFHMKRLCSYLADHQGRVVMGNPNAHNDSNLTPTVIIDPSSSSPLMKNEIFGPILPIITIQKIDDAIAYINKNEKPLVVYYFGAAGGSNYTRVEKETSSGSLIVNDTIFHIANSNLPFGGVGNSGTGRIHGYEGFKSFSNKKSVLSKPALNFYPYTEIYPPFTPQKQGLIKFLMKYLGLTQQQLWKRFLWFLVALYILKLYLNETLSMKTYRKWKGIYDMVMQFMPMIMGKKGKGKPKK